MNIINWQDGNVDIHTKVWKDYHSLWHNEMKKCWQQSEAAIFTTMELRQLIMIKQNDCLPWLLWYCSFIFHNFSMESVKWSCLSYLLTWVQWGITVICKFCPKLSEQTPSSSHMKGVLGDLKSNLCFTGHHTTWSSLVQATPWSKIGDLI